jgi:hypothetical protein
MTLKLIAWADLGFNVARILSYLNDRTSERFVAAHRDIQMTVRRPA